MKFVTFAVVSAAALLGRFRASLLTDFHHYCGVRNPPTSVSFACFDSADGPVAEVLDSQGSGVTRYDNPHNHDRTSTHPLDFGLGMERGTDCD